MGFCWLSLNHSCPNLPGVRVSLSGWPIRNDIFQPFLQLATDTWLSSSQCRGSASDLHHCPTGLAPLGSPLCFPPLAHWKGDSKATEHKKPWLLNHYVEERCLPICEINEKQTYCGKSLTCKAFVIAAITLAKLLFKRSPKERQTCLVPMAQALLHQRWSMKPSSFCNTTT